MARAGIILIVVATTAAVLASSLALAVAIRMRKSYKRSLARDPDIPSSPALARAIISVPLGALVLVVVLTTSFGAGLSALALSRTSSRMTATPAPPPSSPTPPKGSITRVEIVMPPGRDANNTYHSPFDWEDSWITYTSSGVLYEPKCNVTLTVYAVPSGDEVGQLTAEDCSALGGGGHGPVDPGKYRVRLIVIGSGTLGRGEATAEFSVVP